MKLTALFYFIAERVDDTSGVYFVTAFSGLFAPYWRDDARGTMLGKQINPYHQT
jgi:glycerol kinase